jgi:quercetin dioxygenase-like cupin family protein
LFSATISSDRLAVLVSYPRWYPTEARRYPTEEGSPMPLVHIDSLPVIERLPGWHGRYFHSQTMTIAHYDFARGSSIHEHFHPEEEVYEVLEGELELTIDGVALMVRPGVAAIVPSNARHSMKALTDGRMLVVDSPRRNEFPSPDAGSSQLS